MLPLSGSLQGHPDSGEVWQAKINEVIMSYGFFSTTHEPCLHQGIYKGQDILVLCCQVNDMLMSGKDEKIEREFAVEYLQS